MTARDHLRFGNRRLARGRAAIDAMPAPSLGEMLQLARERKGVDLYRAERDTKIRLRYLAALEDGAFDELPAPVYTKGFLRNYAIYLGLDPDEALQRYRDEMMALRTAERVIVAPPPRPIAAPRRGPTITAGMFMAGLVLLAVLGFVVYIGAQLLRFAEVTSITLTHPASVISQIDAESIVLEGTSGAGALISIHGPGGSLVNTTADEQGNWSREVTLAKGRNDFRIIAQDRVTDRQSAPMSLQITVPLPIAPASGAPSPSAPANIRLTLHGPLDGFTSIDGQVTVSGTTTGTRVVIAAELLGAPGASPAPTEPPATPATPPGSPAASPGPTGPLRDLTVAPGGSFSETLALEPGRWQIDVTASASGLPAQTLRRTVTVSEPDQLVVVITATRGSSWMRIVTDGTRMTGWGGPTLTRGSSVTITAETEIFLRSGNAGALDVSINGRELGRLGRPGEVGNWLIRPGTEPERTTETR